MITPSEEISLPSGFPNPACRRLCPCCRPYRIRLPNRRCGRDSLGHDRTASAAVRPSLGVIDVAYVRGFGTAGTSPSTRPYIGLVRYCAGQPPFEPVPSHLSRAEGPAGHVGTNRTLRAAQPPCTRRGRGDAGKEIRGDAGRPRISGVSASGQAQQSCFPICHRCWSSGGSKAGEARGKLPQRPGCLPLVPRFVPRFVPRIVCHFSSSSW